MGVFGLLSFDVNVEKKAWGKSFQIDLVVMMLQYKIGIWCVWCLMRQAQLRNAVSDDVS